MTSYGRHLGALGTALLIVTAGTPAWAQEGALTVVDELGRAIALEGPIQRAVVVGGYDVDIVAAIGGIERIVGVTRADLDQNREAGRAWADEWNVGEWAELSYEAVVNVDPDAVIIYANGGWEEAARQLEPFDIPVIVASGWENQKFEATVALLGQAFGLEEGADAVLAFRQGILDTIDERVGDLPVRTVYYENEIANQTPTRGSGFYEAIVAGHGESIFADVVFGEEGHTQGTVWKTPIDAAEILNRDPDIIIREFGNNYSGTTQDVFDAEARDLVERPGWSDLTAYANDDIFVVNAYLLGQQAKTLTSLHVASWLYPEAFADFDVDAVARQWSEDFLGIPFKGNEGVYYQRIGAGS